MPRFCSQHVISQGKGGKELAGVAACSQRSSVKFVSSQWADGDGTEPGGYLQWNDVDIDAQYLARALGSSQAATKPTEDMMALILKLRSSSAFNRVAKLGEVLDHQGLCEVQFERCTISDHNKMWWGLNCCMLCEEYCVGFEKEKAGSDDEAEAHNHHQTILGAALAAQKGVVVCSSLVVAIGRKEL
ncbi:MAG: hypothetical protein Q9195_003001 [Heterodermia aff. obscurata]